MLESIFGMDIFLFSQINQAWSNPLFDSVMPLLREKLLWFPLYIFAFTFLILNFRWRGFWLILFALLAIGTADQLSSKILKPAFNRPRPCHLEARGQAPRLLVKCGPGKSFPSSHAANHFALAAFFAVLLWRKFKLIVFALFLWASVISYAQVYVGVHYPGDVLAGAVLGVVVGGILGRILDKGIYFLPEDRIGLTSFRTNFPQSG